MYNFGTPWGWYKCIEICRSYYNINIVEIKNIYCALFVAIKTIYTMHGTYIKICSSISISWTLISAVLNFTWLPVLIPLFYPVLSGSNILRWDQVRNVLAAASTPPLFHRPLLAQCQSSALHYLSLTAFMVHNSSYTYCFVVLCCTLLLIWCSVQLTVAQYQ